ncbi:Nucleoside 2-deoxyribosyltransferase [Thermoplasmatales archaeon BRNA1]|nr:Nucleoside 2-deoxyribosyltransferase [Thermoplasmatales archaeon BRNA1]
MSRIYLAGPLFCTSELEYNLKLRLILKEEGFDLVLPQDNSGSIDVGKMSDQSFAKETALDIFSDDLALLGSCDALLLNIDGRVPDEGACVELGYAYAKGMPCFGIKTDIRTAEYGIDNMMIVGALGGNIARSVPELVRMLRDAGL